MTVLADYRFAADDLALGRVAPPDVTVEVDRVFEESETIVGYAWVHGDGVERFRTALADQRVVEAVRPVFKESDRRLFRGEYRDDSDGLLATLLDHDADVLEAAGGDERWRVVLEFPDADRLAHFHQSVAGAPSFSPDLRCVYGATHPTTADAELTERQRETLVTAYRRGYYDIPREITLVDLAAELDISDQAVSERLRRGEAKIVHERLFQR